MGKVLKIVLGVLVVGALALAGLLFLAHDKGEGVQASFFEAVLSGEVAQVKARLHPDLAAEIDDPVLQAWMDAVAGHLGSFQGLSATGFETHVSVGDGGEAVESKGTVRFAKGEATSHIRTQGGQIVAFRVTSQALPENWFTRLEDTSLYRARAEAFLRRLLSADADGALAAMHPDLRARFERDAFIGSLARIQARFGAAPRLTLLEEDFRPGPPQILTLRYAIRGDPGEEKARLQFGAEGMRMHLRAFALPE